MYLGLRVSGQNDLGSCTSIYPGSSGYTGMIQDPVSWILYPGSRILTPGSRIQDPGSWILDSGSRILDPGSRIQDPASGIHPGSWIRDPGSRLQDPRSWILHPPGSWIPPFVSCNCKSIESIPRRNCVCKN